MRITPTWVAAFLFATNAACAGVEAESFADFSAKFFSDDSAFTALRMTLPLRYVRHECDYDFDAPADVAADCTDTVTFRDRVEALSTVEWLRLAHECGRELDSSNPDIAFIYRPGVGCDTDGPSYRFRFERVNGTWRLTEVFNDAGT